MNQILDLKIKHDRELAAIELKYMDEESEIRERVKKERDRIQQDYDLDVKRIEEDANCWKRKTEADYKQALKEVQRDCREDVIKAYNNMNFYKRMHYGFVIYSIIATAAIIVMVFTRFI